jgi:hypothetical protein
MAFKSLVDEVAISIDESIARSQQTKKSKVSKIEETPNIPPAMTTEGGSENEEVVGEGAV